MESLPYAILGFVFLGVAFIFGLALKGVLIVDSISPGVGAVTKVIDIVVHVVLIAISIGTGVALFIYAYNPGICTYFGI